MGWRAFGILLCLVSPLGLGVAQTAYLEAALAPAAIADGYRSKTVSLVQRMAELHVPGVSIAFIEDGTVAWARGFGVTRLGGAPVTPDTLFQAGSISKPVAALGALKLVEAGRLDLDTDVNTYLRDWKLPDNEFTADRKVTLRALLSHTAGVTVHGFPGYVAGQPVPSLMQLLDGSPPANTPPIRVDTVPGTLWRYAGGGYEVMQQLVQDVTAEPFPDFMRETVLAPIGMSHSTYREPLPPERAAEAATPYDEKGAPVQGGPHTYPEMAAAGLWSTPSDLARYAIEVQKSLAGEPGHILSAAMTRKMLTPVAPGIWGLGPVSDGKTDRRFFAHGGSDAGFQSQMIVYEQGQGVVVMTNADGGAELAREIARTVASEQGWPDFGPKTVSAKSFAAQPLFVMSTLDNWQKGQEMRQAAPGRFEAMIDMPAGTHQFKIGSAGFEVIDFGAAHNEGKVKPGQTKALAYGGDNLLLTLAKPGRYIIRLDVKKPLAPSLMVKQA